MIDWLYSKITVVVVVFIMIAFFMGFFKWHNTNIAITELQNVSDEVASNINELTGIEAETNVTITFNDYGQGVRLPTIINNDNYTLNITQDLIFANWKGATVSSRLTHPRNEIITYPIVHLWEPTKGNYSLSEINHLDDFNQFSIIDSGNDFIIERKQIEINAFYQYHTFVYRKTIVS